MTPYYEDDMVTLWHGDCRQVMSELGEARVDAIVTDPPYELAFMGKGWDASGIAYDRRVWENAWHVLKPGGHLLAFGGTRTWHRLACAIEDAGFEIRDSIAWMYGSGFPKSLDVSKAIDRRRDDTEDIHKVVRWLEARRKESGVTRGQIEHHFATQNIGQALFTVTPGSASRVATWDQWLELKSLLGFGDDMDAEVWRLNGRKGKPGEAFALREVVGQRTTGIGTGKGTVQVMGDGTRDITAPATPAAQQWQGWGTALKPAFEPIVVARKPLIGTVAENVLAHGTGALNIDGCRIAASDPFGGGAKATSGFVNGYEHDGWQAGSDKGRWPANVILDESQAAELDRQSGQAGGGFGVRGTGGQTYANGKGFTNTLAETGQTVGYGDTGGASRFFYTAKANSSERPRVNGVAHPTVKPLDLMRYLVRLVTPPGGTVLEPFAGSGTTLEACVMEGFHAIGIELTDEYLPLICQRLSKPIEQVLL